MTLILTRVSNQYVLQVSDRLVTGNRPADRYSNKSIVFVARNACVTMAYTGMAFLEGVPTDQWLAENLRGEAFPRNRKPPAMAIGSGGPHAVLDLGSALERLRQALDAVAGKMRAHERTAWRTWCFDLCIAGWQWYRGNRIRPVSAWLGKAEGVEKFDLEYEPRERFLLRSVLLIDAPSGNLRREDAESLLAAISSAPPDVAETAMTAAIRQVSARVPAVGRDCMAVLLPPPRYQLVRIRYAPLMTEYVGIRRKKGMASVPIVFSPWVVSPSLTFAPSIVGGGGGFQLNTGWFDVDIQSPGDLSPVSIVSGQARPKYR